MFTLYSYLPYIQADEKKNETITQCNIILFNIYNHQIYCDKHENGKSLYFVFHTLPVFRKLMSQVMS